MSETPYSVRHDALRMAIYYAGQPHSQVYDPEQQAKEFERFLLEKADLEARLLDKLPSVPPPSEPDDEPLF